MALRSRQTWIMSFLYIGTFGSFIGFSFALPLVIKNTFPEFLASHPFIATYLAGLSFMGALIGSLARPLGGWLSDKVGGARVTLVAFVGMAVFTVMAIFGVQNRSFGAFFASYMVIFLLTGICNGSTYKMIPSIFAVLGRQARPGVRRGPQGHGGRVQAPGGRGHRHRRRHRRLRRRAHPGRAAPGQPRASRPWSRRPRPRPRRSPSPRPTPTGRSRPCGCSSPATSCSPPRPGSSTSAPARATWPTRRPSHWRLQAA